MKTEKITVSVAMTINLGNYQSIRPSIELTGTLEEGDNVDKCHEELSAHATALFYKSAWSDAYNLSQVTSLGIEAAAADYLENFKK
jgi:hypothetical protein